MPHINVVPHELGRSARGRRAQPRSPARTRAATLRSIISAPNAPPTARHPHCRRQHRHPRTLRDLLPESGLSVVTAHDGAAAIQVTLDHEPDVIVMDLAMPQSTATRPPKRIKGDARMSRTRVMPLTGYPDCAAERGSVGSGADMFARRPGALREQVTTAEGYLVAAHPPT